MHILAIAAHPDDIEEMCFGTLMRYHEAGHKIYIVLTTSGNGGSNIIQTRKEIGEIRESEVLESTKFYEAQVKFLRFEDEGLCDTQEARTAVLNAVRWADPDIIFTHSPHDASPDHNMTARLLISIIQILNGNLYPTQEKTTSHVPDVFFWDIPGGFNFEPEAYVDVSKYIDQKLLAIACHKSQISWMSNYLEDDYVESMRIQARFRGYQSGYKYAEGFKAFRMLGYVADYRLLP